jgi:hypothetical protein
LGSTPSNVTVSVAALLSVTIDVPDGPVLTTETDCIAGNV